MSVKHTYLASEAIVCYARQSSSPEHPVLEKCRAETAGHPQAQMQLGAEQGTLLRILIALTKAKKALEVGVFTGYSSTLTALELPADGLLVACDVSEEFTSQARRYWQEAGVENKIDLRIGPAAATLQTLIDEGYAGAFDFALIDADKTSYDTYYELTLKLLRPGGLAVLDNTLRQGRVLEQLCQQPDVTAMRELNCKLSRDERVLVSLLPITDGMTLAWKR